MTKPRPEITGASPRHYDPRVARIAEEYRGYKIGMQEKFVTISGSMTKPRPVWANRGFCPSLLMGAGHELAETIARNILLHCERDHTATVRKITQLDDIIWHEGGIHATSHIDRDLQEIKELLEGQ